MPPDPAKQADASVPARNLFGTFGGVFTPCILTILGVIMFMRANFVVGEAGILGAVLVLLVAKSISLATVLSASAIATNLQVRGGGAYFLISRVLGPEFGGAIGIVLYLAQAISVPFYLLGFTEALVQTVPALRPHFVPIVFGTGATLFVVAYVGAGWAIRVQYVIMAILGASIAAFLGGALRLFSPETFAANWLSAYTPVQPDAPGGGSYTFWMCFAIYFPAVTGIMAGINMSGDLKDPGRSIPRGILSAVLVALAVYLAQVLICGGAFERGALVTRPYLLLKENALFGSSMLVAAGMFAATLSSALGSLLGAPRVLQAVARDKILPPLRPFAKGARKGDEPRRALIATGVLTAAVLLWAVTSHGNALNLVAGVITMFFLYTYGMLNVGAFIEAFSGNPSFRPRFRLFHWTTALAGGLGCGAVAFVISPAQAVVAVLVMAGLVWHIKARELRTTFGDARRGFVYKAVRNSLLKLARMEETPKNWRPTSLVFSGNPESREALVTYAVWFEAGRGIVFLANVLVGRFEEYAPRRQAALRQLAEFCRERDIHAFPAVVIDENLEHGMMSLMQALRIGPIGPNLAMFGWSGQSGRTRTSVDQFRTAQAMGMSIIVLCDNEGPFGYRKKRIDIWWRGRKNGSLMVLLAHLLTCNWEWSGADIRLLRQVEKDAAHENTLACLEQLIRDARVDATAKVVIGQEPFEDVLHKESSDADCVILGFEVPEPGQESQWYGRYETMVHNMPTAVLVCSNAGEDLMA